MLRYLVKHVGIDVINLRAKSKTLKWKCLRGLAKIMCRTGIARSSLIKRIAHGTGMTALHYAARRGDMRSVEVLLSNGADPLITTSMGRTSIDMCKSFQEIRGVLEKQQRRNELLRGTRSKFVIENLGKRLSKIQITQINFTHILQASENKCASYSHHRHCDTHSLRHVVDLVGDYVDAVRVEK